MSVEPWQYVGSSARAYGLGEVDALLAENAEYLGLSDCPARRQVKWCAFLIAADDQRLGERQRAGGRPQQ